MHRLIFLLLIFIANNAFAQRSDVIMLKKRNKTIERYYSGKDISFITNTGAAITANIDGIKSDTVFLKQYVIQRIPTSLGVFVLDTVTKYYYKYHYNQIKTIGKENKKFNMAGSAASLIGGGLLLTVASGVVFLVDRKNFSPALLTASASLAGIGYLMFKTSGRGINIGKKYHLVYISLSDNKKL